MSFKKPLPTWKAQGIQPPEHKLEEGWKAQDKPPAGWLNWQANTTYEALQELQDNAVDHRDVTSEPSESGVVRLNEAGKLNEAVLADAEHKEITLKPGVQIVESDQDTPFNVGSIKGRTLINLLGRAGACEDASAFSVKAGAARPTWFEVQLGKGMLATWESANMGSTYACFAPLSTALKAGAHYVAIASVGIVRGDMSAWVVLRKEDAMDHNGNRISVGMAASTCAFVATGTEKLIGIYFSVNNAVGAVNFDNIRLYEISQTEYDAIATMTSEQVAAKYPYVDSMTNVTNPYAIATSGNLLPPFTEWANNGNKKLHDLYELEITTPIPDDVNYYLRVAEETTMTLSVEHTGLIGVNAWDANNELIGGQSIVRYTKSQQASFTTPTGTTHISVHLGNVDGNTSLPSCKFKKPILTPTTTPQPFAPQSCSMWAAECQLAANPLDGSNADVLFTGDDGLPYVLEKWKKVKLDGALPWVYDAAPKAGVKTVKIAGFAIGRDNSKKPVSVKYNGELLVVGGSSTGADIISESFWHSTSNHALIISISNTDSGWGDAYEPTADEIKAYFLGWRMALSSDWSAQYNGNGDRIWIAIGADALSSGAATLTLPTAPPSVDSTWQPYRLQYLKTKPTVEPVRNYETGLTLCEGSNVVEVGSGIVLREKANTVTLGLNYLINHKDAPNSALKYRTNDIMSAYRNNGRGSNATIATNNAAGLGGSFAFITPQNFDPTAVYHVTYTMLDPTLSAPINGNVAMNLRGVVSDLAQHTGDIERRLSVVENQKADEESPQWIAPTMLNGSASHDASPAMYKKWNGLVFLKGLFTTTSSTVIFKFPIGYRPNKSVILNIFSVTSGNLTPSNLEIKPDGDVRVGFHGTDYSSLDGIIFEAEQ
ncbi:hypothetical protein [Paenibacillus aquistagni]|uniref:Uncharacterized protein n=1 Tax=Paenibacillus aquistagni TaxID=1852522 RepID=A0A1X7KAD1_9BACL|nr:hypothetical protein [Paenibacillus aquistagni]SMG37954.1 hypothetical protein SAMN06295960_2263 [Paenibacillus aquistagni]